MWVFTEAGDGYVYWHPRNNVSLVIQGGDLDSYPSMAKNTGEDTQKWKIIKDETSGNYRIQNKASGKYGCNRKRCKLAADPDERRKCKDIPVGHE